MEGNVSISRVDIVMLAEEADVVVNSANPFLGGIGPDLPEGVGGVDGAIHRAAGRALYERCVSLPVVSHSSTLGGWIRCAPGNLVVTEAFGVSGAHIYHAVGPIYRGGRDGEWSILDSVYRRVFMQFEESGHKSMVLPPIATGSYCMPMRPAAYLAILHALSYATENVCDIKFSVVNDAEREIYLQVISEMIA